MVVEAHKMGILYNKEVVLAFEALGRYYETTKTCIQHAKASDRIGGFIQSFSS